MSPQDEPASETGSWRWHDLLVGPLAGASWTVCLGIGLHAVNWLAVATVLPETARALDRVDLIDAATAIYLAAFILGSVMGGAAKTRFGARAVMSAGTVLILLGTGIMAAAPSMAVALAGRVGQGLGEGLVVALSYALIRELFPHRAVPRAFGLIGVVYAVAALAAPPVIGGLTDLVSWRVGLAALIVPAIALLLVSRRVVPGRAPAEAADPPYRLPVLRLALLAAGITSVTAASTVSAAPAAIALLAAGPALAVLAARIDRASAERLLPRDLLNPRAPVAGGLAVVLAMSLAAPGIHVFAPLIAKEAHGASTALAGVLVSLTALAWSTTAILTAGAGPVYARRSVLGGPVLLAIGLAVVAAGLGGGALGVAAFGIALVGCAFGASWAFLSQRVMALATAEDHDRTAAAIPTLQAAGGAAGAALAGVVADVTSLVPALEAGGPIVGPVAAIYGAGAVVAGIATLAAIRLAAPLPGDAVAAAGAPLQAGAALRSSRGERP